jgi:hypothetical protein
MARRTRLARSAARRHAQPCLCPPPPSHLCRCASSERTLPQTLPDLGSQAHLAMCSTPTAGGGPLLCHLPVRRCPRPPQLHVSARAPATAACVRGRLARTFRQHHALPTSSFGASRALNHCPRMHLPALRGVLVPSQRYTVNPAWPFGPGPSAVQHPNAMRAQTISAARTLGPFCADLSPQCLSHPQPAGRSAGCHFAPAGHRPPVQIAARKEADAWPQIAACKRQDGAVTGACACVACVTGRP